MLRSTAARVKDDAVKREAEDEDDRVGGKPLWFECCPWVVECNLTS